LNLGEKISTDKNGCGCFQEGKKYDILAGLLNILNYSTANFEFFYLNYHTNAIPLHLNSPKTDDKSMYTI
jgi:hypothetical protein